MQLFVHINCTDRAEIYAAAGGNYESLNVARQGSEQSLVRSRTEGCLNI